MIAAFQTFHCSPMVGPGQPIDAVIAAAASAGFRAIGLDRASLDASFAAGGAPELIVAQLRSLRLAPVDLIHLPLTGDARHDGAELDRVMALLDAIPLPWCLAAVPTMVSPPALERSARHAARVLASRGTRLAVEFCSHLAVATLDAARVVASAAGHGAALVIDSLHFARTGSPWAALQRLSSEQIAYLQLSDAGASPTMAPAVESRTSRLLPGTGALPLRRLLETCADLGFDGFVAAEVLTQRWAGVSPSVVAEQVSAAMTAVLGSASRHRQ